MRARSSSFGYYVTVLGMLTVLAGCGNKEPVEAWTGPPPVLVFVSSDQPTAQPTAQPTVLPTAQLTAQPTAQPTVLPTAQPTAQPTPTLLVIGPLIDPNLDIKAGPVDVPLELQIPSLHVRAPVLGVGLTSENIMDAPQGPIGDPIWHKAFWYRGGGIPGDSGTATIAGHVDDRLGKPEIFAHLQDIHSGDVIIIHATNTNIDIRFVVNRTAVYTVQESTDPAVLSGIYGAGPVAGTGPQPALDGLSHLTLITCAGNFVNGQYDHRKVVYATRSK